MVMRQPRRSPSRRRHGVLRGLAIFGAAGLLAAVLFLVIAFWPSPESTRYQEAKPCVFPPPAPTADCTMTVGLTVLEVHETYGRGGNHYYFVLGAASRPTTARVNGFLGWIPRFRVGETVQAEVWNGIVVRLSGDGGTFVTAASPLSRRQDFERAAAFLGIAAWLPFLLGLADSLRRVR